MRTQKTLNKNWKFYHGELNDAFYKDFEDFYWQDVTIPHDWSVEYPFDKSNSSGTGYLEGGIGWYRLHFDLKKDVIGKNISINFDGVYKNSKVWCNSNYLGQRPYGYASFSYDISEFAVEGENVIVVRAEHVDTADSRWFTGNGIYREVSLIVKEQEHFAENGIFASTFLANDEEAVLNIAFDANTLGQAEFELCNADNEVVTKASAEIQNGSCNLTLKSPVLWSDENPYLYTLTSKLIVNDKVCDVVQTKVGIRTISFNKDLGFFLNGKNMKLKGVCVHHDAGALGAAVPADVCRERLLQLKACGTNALRIAHNPPAANLLDICDEIGLLVMDEAFDEWEGCKNKWWQGHNVYPPKHYGYANEFPMWHEKDLSAMVLRDRNHPSVIIWSIGNEIDYPNDPYVHPLFEEVAGNNDKDKPKEEMIYNPSKPNAQRLATISANLSAIVKKLDVTRPVTSAISFPELSNLTGYAQTLDIIGYNYKEQYYHEDHKKYPEHIIYGSENGKDAKSWFDVTDNDHICGQFIWIGFDFIGEAKGWPIRNSQAGLMDIAGTEKPIYYLRKALWAQEKFAKLSTLHNENETFTWNYEENSAVEVTCYSNYSSAELFVNGKSCGAKEIDRSCAVKWNVDYEAGEIYVKCGDNICDKLITHGKASKFEAIKSKEALTANGEDVIKVTYSLKDENGVDVNTHDIKVNFSIVGDAEIIGIENGNAADLTAYKEKYRYTYNGKIVVYVRAGENAETLELNAYSEELKVNQSLSITQK